MMPIAATASIVTMRALSRASRVLDVVIGIVSEADVIAKHGATVGEIMTPEVVSVTETTPIEHIAALMAEKRIKRLPVIVDGALIGMVSRADIDRGEVTFEGRRYRITRGSMDFTNPTRIEPFFDVEAETNVRVTGQTYRVTVGFAGTPDRMRPTPA